MGGVSIQLNAQTVHEGGKGTAEGQYLTTFMGEKRKEVSGHKQTGGRAAKRRNRTGGFRNELRLGLIYRKKTQSNNVIRSTEWASLKRRKIALSWELHTHQIGM